MSKLHHQTLEPDLAPFGDRDQGSPGKRSMTQNMSPRPIIFRVESAEAARELGAAFGPRDRQGVVAGAEAVVERAASDSGHQLRDDVRERFESSLGADLSAVRVHTGRASEEAADAVGARAYTVGNDIHFGAGEYRPDDPFGLHLLAHEVAHTQQQAGETPHRQHKLAVTSTGDAAEIEADRAADAMVSGAPCALAVGGNALARKEKPAADGAKGPSDEPGNGKGLSQSGGFSVKKGPFTAEIAISEAGAVSISGSVSAGNPIPTAIPGIFAEWEIAGKLTGEGAMGKDGSATIKATVEVSGQFTLNGGVPKVASAYGGGALIVKLPPLKFSKPANGAWNIELADNFSLNAKAVLGVKAEVIEALGETLPPGWQAGWKYECSPGGEFELAVFNWRTGKASAGAGLQMIGNKINGALQALRIKDPELLPTDETETDAKIQADRDQEALERGNATLEKLAEAQTPPRPATTEEKIAEVKPRVEQHYPQFKIKVEAARTRASAAKGTANRLTSASNWDGVKPAAKGKYSDGYRLFDEGEHSWAAADHAAKSNGEELLQFFIHAQAAEREFTESAERFHEGDALQGGR